MTLSWRDVKGQLKFGFGELGGDTPWRMVKLNLTQSLLGPFAYRHIGAGSTNVGPPSSENLWGLPTGSKRKPNDRVLFIFVIQFQCRFLYTVVHAFDYSLFWDIILRFTNRQVWPPNFLAHVWGPYSTAHVRTFLNPALPHKGKKVKALHLYSATSGNCSFHSAVRHRLGRTCSL